MKLFIAILSICLASTCWSQSIDDKEKKALIDTVSARLRGYYVFADKAEAISKELARKEKEGGYSGITQYRDFVNALASDIQRVHTDRHMNLMFNPGQAAQLKQRESSTGPTAAMVEEEAAFARASNFGFVKLERLSGNIGYVDLRQFHRPTPEAENKVAAAMNFLADADALVIDLRQNGGGDPEMVQQVLSYFIDKPVHYNTIYDRRRNRSEKYLTLASVKGRKMPQVDLYVLTSSFTFSGAEELAYDLQSLKRATIIGEKTGGGAHPTDLVRINDNVVMAIPVARSVNAFTNTNWEGTGVSPEVAVPAEKALIKARELAFEKLLAKEKNDAKKEQYRWQLEGIRAAMNPAVVKAKELKSYAAVYGDRSISFEDGALWYQRGKNPKRKLVPMTSSVFSVEGLDYFRISFEKNDKGDVTGLTGLYDNGRREPSARTDRKSF